MLELKSESDVTVLLRDQEPSGDWGRDWARGRQLADEAIQRANRMAHPGAVSSALHKADMESPLVLGFLWRLAERAMASRPMPDRPWPPAAA